MSSPAAAQPPVCGESGYGLLTDVAETVAYALRVRLHAVSSDLAGMGAALEEAAAGSEVSEHARDMAIARAGGFRDAGSILRALLGHLPA